MARLLQLLCLVLAAAIGGPAVAASLNDYPFRVDTVTRGEREDVLARNDGPAPITVHVSLKSQNIATGTAWPLTAVVPPHSTLSLGDIAPVDATQAYRYLFSYTYYAGRIDAAPAADALYRYPFPDGATHAITQAHGGALTSHDNRQNLYAVDFDMPVGTPILAARAGTVVDVVLKHTEGGSDTAFLEKANMVTIVHDDGTLAEYAHLAPGPALVVRGQRVEAGTMLGSSGNTGYSTGPHLHFVVSRPEIENGKVIRLSLPVLFYADDARVAVPPRTGTMATAAYGSTTRGDATDVPRATARQSTEGVPLADRPLTAHGTTDRH